MKSLFRTLTMLVVLASLAFAVTGCGNKEARKMRRNLNPEMGTPIEHWQQYLNRVKISKHHNLRQVPDDWARFMLNDRPNRLTPYVKNY